MSKKAEISQEEIDAILAVDPTQEELDTAMKNFLESVVMPERKTPLPESPDDDYYEADEDDNSDDGEDEDGEDDPDAYPPEEEAKHDEMLRNATPEDRAAYWNGDFVDWNSAKKAVDADDQDVNQADSR